MDYPPSIGGIQTFTFDLYNALREHGHTIKILNFDGRNKKNDSVLSLSDFFYTPATNNSYYSLIKILNPFLFLEPGGYRDFVFSNMIYRITQKTAQTFKPDLIHIMKNSLYASVFNSKIPFVVSCHMGAEDIFDEYPIHYSLKNAKRIHFVSKFIKSLALRIEKRLDKDTTIIYNSINLKQFEKIRTNKKKQIITISRLVKSKNIDTLIKAFALFSEKNKDYRYVIVGDGPEIKNLKNLTKKLELTNVIFKGKIKNAEKKIKLLKESDIFLLCPETKNKIEEAFGMVYIEAQAAGLPIICSNTGGILEAVGQSGIVIKDEKSVNEISEALIRLIANKNTYMKLVHEGQKRIKVFDKKMWIQSFLNFYNYALSKNH